MITGELSTSFAELWRQLQTNGSVPVSSRRTLESLLGLPLCTSTAKRCHGCGYSCVGYLQEAVTQRV